MYFALLQSKPPLPPPPPRHEGVPGRVAVLGYDGMSHEILQPLIRMGKAPAFAALQRQGSYGYLKSTLPFLSPPAWMSAVTGVNPGKHGIFGFFQLRELENGEFRPFFMTSRLRRSKGVWELFNDFNLTAGVVNLPLSNPAEMVDGYMLAGWPYQRVGHLEQTSDPAKLFPILERTRFAHVELNQYPFNLTEPEKYRAFYENAMAMHRRAFLALYQDFPTDLFWGVFTATDRIQHNLWQYYQPSLYPSVNSFHVRRQSDAVPTTYRQAEDSLREFMDVLRKEDALFVLSDHGFGPVNKRILAANILDLFLDSESRSTKAIFVESGLRVNLKGREPSGIVPQRRYEEVRSEIIDILQGLTDPDTGTPLFKAVVPREEEYSGPHIDNGADVLVVPNDGYFLYDAPDKAEGQLVDDLPLSLNTGFHRRNGVLLAWGEGIRERGRAPLAIIEDVTPTVLARMGLPVATSMDGRPLEEWMTRDFLDRFPPRIVEMDISRDMGAVPEFSKELEEQLRSLSYIQ